MPTNRELIEKEIPPIDDRDLRFFLDGFGIRLTNVQRAVFGADIAFNIRKLAQKERKPATWYACWQLHKLMVERRLAFESAVQRVDWPNPGNVAAFMHRYYRRDDAALDAEAKNRVAVKVEAMVAAWRKEQAMLQDELSRTVNPIRKWRLQHRMMTINEWFMHHDSYLRSQLSDQERRFLPQVLQPYLSNLSTAAASAAFDAKAVRRWVQDAIDVLHSQDGADDAIAVLDWNSPLRSDDDAKVLRKGLTIKRELDALGFTDLADDLERLGCTTRKG